MERVDGNARAATGKDSEVDETPAQRRVRLRSEANRHGLTLHGIYRDGVYLGRRQHWLVIV